MVRVLMFAFLVVAASGCSRASPEQCDKLCLRFNELHFWEKFEADAAALAPDAREKLHAERQKEWEAIVARDFDPGRENCVKECRRSAGPKEVKCVEAAKTGAEAKKCLE